MVQKTKATNSSLKKPSPIFSTEFGCSFDKKQKLT